MPKTVTLLRVRTPGEAHVCSQRCVFLAQDGGCAVFNTCPMGDPKSPFYCGSHYHWERANFVVAEE